jgi:hypothetical protein
MGYQPTRLQRGVGQEAGAVWPPAGGNNAEPTQNKHMNILDKECRALAPSFGKHEYAVPKREKFSWAQPSDPGIFVMIDKDRLNIDGTYQREQVSKSKVLDIARNWDWKLFGTLSVILRNDGSFWIYDGGHRCRAAFLRDDIMELPCMVFEAENPKEEAMAFVGANTMKSVVSAYHIHRASVKSEEPIALAAQSVVEKYGYSVVSHGKQKHGFQGIGTLLQMVRIDGDLADKVFGVCADIAQDGEAIPAEVLRAIFDCQKKLQGKEDILAGSHFERLKRETLPGIHLAIRREKHISGQGGELVRAKAILNLINKGKHRRIRFE